MPYPNEHAARVVDPSKFQQNSFRRKNISDGVDAIIGKLKGETKTTVQAYRFNSKKFTVEQAKKWLKENKINYILFEPAKNQSMKKLLLYAPIYRYTAEAFVNKMLEVDAAEDLEIWVNSPGGSVFAGWSIIGPLNERTGKNIAKVFGDASSMAFYSLLFMDRVEALDVSSFMIHRADGYTETDEDKQFLVDVNKQLRSKLEAKIDPEKFKEVTGKTFDQIFDLNQRIDVILSAKDAKKIGLVDKIIKVDSEKLAAFSEKFVSFYDSDDEFSRGSDVIIDDDNARGSAEKDQNINKNKVEQKQIKKMTREEFKSQNPEAYAEIVAQAQKDERDRIEAFLEFVEIDAESVKKHISEGNAMTNKFMAEMTKKMASNAMKKEIKEDAPENQNLNAEDEKKKEEIEAENFEKEVNAHMKFKDEEE